MSPTLTLPCDTSPLRQSGVSRRYVPRMRVVPRTAAPSQYRHPVLPHPARVNQRAQPLRWWAGVLRNHHTVQKVRDSLFRSHVKEPYRHEKGGRGDTARLSLPLRLTASADNSCGDDGDGLQGPQTPHTRVSDRILVPESYTSRG
jgi:hypothetical protein